MFCNSTVALKYSIVLFSEHEQPVNNYEREQRWHYDYTTLICVLGFGTATPEIEHDWQQSIAKAFAISSREPYETVAAIVDCLQHFYLLRLRTRSLLAIHARACFTAPEKLDWLLVAIYKNTVHVQNCYVIIKFLLIVILISRNPGNYWLMQQVLPGL